MLNSRRRSAYAFGSTFISFTVGDMFARHGRMIVPGNRLKSDVWPILIPWNR
jgi:hypothetical protein